MHVIYHSTEDQLTAILMGKNDMTKIIYVLFGFFLFSQSAYADCETKINNVSDGASIKEALSCLEAEITEMKKTGVKIPKDVVLAFDDDRCPQGWEEYKQAYGKFIRGVDKSGKLIDPDGQRHPGTPQGDSYEKHTHTAHLQVGAEPPKGAGGARSSRAAG